VLRTPAPLKGALGFTGPFGDIQIGGCADSAMSKRLRTGRSASLENDNVASR
jgi:hypothetical protein